jgi:hypothetical protein
MAVLPDGDRQALHKAIMSDLSARRESLGLTKAELRAAVDAIDQWVDDNAISFNTAIPLPARTTLTAKQKVELFMSIVKRRWEVA